MGLPTHINKDEKPYTLYEGVDYRVFWEGKPQHLLDELEHSIVQDLLPASGTRMIDIGCGYGRLANCYLNRFQHVVMFDGSISLLRQARENTGGQAWYVAGDISHFPFRNSSFDQALMVRVFHHLPDSSACIHELSRVISHEGRLVFSYFNKRNLSHILKWIIRKDADNPFGMETTGQDSTLIQHHPQYVDRILKESGFISHRYRGAGIMDKIARRLGPVARFIPQGYRIAPALGRMKISPWIFCEAIATGNPTLAQVNSLEDLLQCAACGNSLVNETQYLFCSYCKKEYPIVDGIVDLRLK